MVPLSPTKAVRDPRKAEDIASMPERDNDKGATSVTPGTDIMSSRSNADLKRVKGIHQSEITDYLLGGIFQQGRRSNALLLAS